MADKRQMARLVSGLPSKSEKMRVLSKAGFSRQQIADFLGVRYQFVRNVLVEAAKKRQAMEVPAQGVHEEEREFLQESDTDPTFARGVVLGPDGTVRVPQSMMRAAGIEPGARVLVRYDGHRIEIYSPAEAIRHMQAEIRKYVPEGHSLVDDLLRERRREVNRERGGA